MQKDGKCDANVLYLIILLIAFVNSNKVLYTITTKLRMWFSEIYYWFYFYAETLEWAKGSG